MIPPALFPVLRYGYVLERREAPLFAEPLYPADIIPQEASGLLVVLRLDGIAQIELEVVRRKIRVEEPGELLLPVPLIELFLSRRGRLSLFPSPESPLSCLEHGEDIHVEVFPAIIPLFPIDCPHAFNLRAFTRCEGERAHISPPPSPPRAPPHPRRRVACLFFRGKEAREGGPLYGRLVNIPYEPEKAPRALLFWPLQTVPECVIIIKV